MRDQRSGHVLRGRCWCGSEPASAPGVDLVAGEAGYVRRRPPTLTPSRGGEEERGGRGGGRGGGRQRGGGGRGGRGRGGGRGGTERVGPGAVSAGLVLREGEVLALVIAGRARHSGRGVTGGLRGGVATHGDETTQIQRWNSRFVTVGGAGG